MIKNYDWKYSYLACRQNFICSGCGEFFDASKTDIAHNFPRTKKNMKNYPLMIDSLLNITLQHNRCNVGRKPAWGKKPMNYHKAEMINWFLQRHPKICDFVNGRI